MSGRDGGRQGRGRGRGDHGGGPPPGRGRGQQGGGRVGGSRGGGGARGSGLASGEPAGGVQYMPKQPIYQPQQVTTSRPPPPARQQQHPHPPEGAPYSSSSSPVQSVTRQMEKSLSLSGSDLPSAAEHVGAASSSSTALTRPLPAISPECSSLRPPLRPGFGRVGQPCRVRANHFLVQLSNTNMEMCHYDVAITPEVTSRAVNRDILNQLVRLYGESHLGKRLPAYDGRKNLYTAGPLPFTSKEFAIKLIEKDLKGATKKEREFKVAIKFAIKTDLYQLQEFLRGKLLDSPHDTIQLLDVVLRETPSNNYTTIARSFFSTNFGPAERIENGVECWRGYYQSLRPTQMGLSLNIDLSATSFYEPLNIIDFISQYLNQNLSRPLSDIEWAKVKKVLRGVKVETTHRPDVRARYRITGISSVSANQLEFVGADGTKTTVSQYFRAAYQVSLKFASWPCLLAGSSTKPAYLPLEVCKIVPGQRYTKKLNDKQISKILKMTCKRPNDRENGIAEMAKKNNYVGDALVKEFGIQVLNNLTSVEARILPPPMLKYHDSGREKSCQPRVGQWNMINKRMVDGSTVHSWACLNFSNVFPNAVENFCYELIGMCSNMGMSFNPNPVFGLDSAQPNKIEVALHRLYKNCVQKLPTGQYLQLLIVILPDRSGSYGKIKKICETELGIVSQCCQPRNVVKCNKQYLENVALKINVKCGGRNTVLNDVMTKNLPAITSAPCIIFGADVTHPQPGEDSSPSIAAVVASMDWPQITKYRGLVSAQGPREEIIRDLYTSTTHSEKGIVHGGMIRELLLAYYRSTNCKPFRIIFYRDGVSEGQFKAVLLYEMDAIRKACASLQSDYLPPVTFVVVQKRHHTRLFPVDRSLTDRSGNIVPGTVVDTSICHPSEFDFYLCSHAGIQGTSRPTHYHVLHDDNKFSADGLQTLTNSLCYTYARCTRSVSIVPPAYYAHLAAFRARYYTEGNASDGYSAPADSGGGRDRAVEIVALPQIKENVKNVMFFC